MVLPEIEEEAEEDTKLSLTSLLLGESSESTYSPVLTLLESLLEQIVTTL